MQRYIPAEQLIMGGRGGIDLAWQSASQQYSSVVPRVVWCDGWRSVGSLDVANDGQSNWEEERGRVISHVPGQKCSALETFWQYSRWGGSPRSFSTPEGAAV